MSRARVAGALRLGASVLVLCAAGCLPDPDPPRVYEPCPDAGCDPGTLCVTLYQNGVELDSCLPFCDPRADASACATGEICTVLRGSPSDGFCADPCEGDDDCSPGRTCNPSTGLCECDSPAVCNDPGDSTYTCNASSRCALACSRDGACACGSICELGACEDGCRTDDDCCGESTCVAGRCTASAPGPVGSSCYYAEQDCAPDLFCLRTGYERGICIPSVAGDTCGEIDCPAGTACGRAYVSGATTPAALAICPPGCAPGVDEACGPYAVCVADAASPEGGVCAPRCADDAFCGPGGECDLATGLCKCLDHSWCSTLGTAAVCDVGTGQCSCTPDCAGRSCGDDGCGGTCGSCPSNLLCDTTAGVCHGSCGTSIPYVDCGTGTVCPPNSMCNADGSCTCLSGYNGYGCDGTPCTYCSWEWICA